VNIVVTIFLLRQNRTSLSERCANLLDPDRTPLGTRELGCVGHEQSFQRFLAGARAADPARDDIDERLELGAVSAGETVAEMLVHGPGPTDHARLGRE
jgi:hypothetical protein